MWTVCFWYGKGLTLRCLAQRSYCWYSHTSQGIHRQKGWRFLPARWWGRMQASGCAIHEECWLYVSWECMCLSSFFYINFLLPLTWQPGPASSNKEKRAYFHPAIIASIRDCFFTGTRGSLAEKHEASFTSSIMEGPGKDERELPISMVCLIATTVSQSCHHIFTCLRWSIHRFMLPLMNGVKGSVKRKEISGQKLMRMYIMAMICSFGISRRKNPFISIVWWLISTNKLRASFFVFMWLYFYMILTHHNRNGSKTSQSANKIAQAAMSRLNFDEIDG